MINDTEMPNEVVVDRETLFMAELQRSVDLRHEMECQNLALVDAAKAALRQGDELHGHLEERRLIPPCGLAEAVVRKHDADAAVKAQNTMARESMFDYIDRIQMAIVKDEQSAEGAFMELAELIHRFIGVLGDRNKPLLSNKFLLALYSDNPQAWIDATYELNGHFTGIPQDTQLN